ncbi:MAG: antitoxin Xre/MbcA/ParS toxin-binding domain-containing protein [Mangrovibacterium sp.]
MTETVIHRKLRSIGSGSKVDIFLNADSSEILSSLMESTDLSQKLLSSVFEMTEKTFSNYKNNNRRLSPLTAELAIKIIELYEEGKETFGSLKNFNRWMTRPAPGLNHRIPFELIQTVTGVELVMDELMAIQYGAPV